MSAPAPGRQTGSFGDELTNAAMIGLIGVFALTLLLRGAGSVAAFLTGTAQPLAGPAAGVEPGEDQHRRRCTNAHVTRPSRGEDGEAAKRFGMRPAR